ncbi:oligoendopeptidase F [Alicyclobacillus contaminans]|nr:oligoendopeptidase F [Alicyclobacillus contaminans]
MTKRVRREEVPEALTWNLADLFPSEAEWLAELTTIEADVRQVTQYQGRLGESAEVLERCLTAREALQGRLSRAQTWASLRQSADSTNPVNQANAAKVDTLAARISAELAFVPSEILSLPTGTIRQFLNDERLRDFRVFLEDLLAKKPHTLSPETERVLAALSSVHAAPYLIYQRSKLSDMAFASVVDAKGEEHPVSFALYEDHYELSSDTDLRRRAFASFTATLRRYQHTFAATLATEVNKQVTLAKQRRYGSVTEMLLQPQKVTLEMYHSILDVIQQELAPHMQRYAALRKRVLGLDTLHFCDLKSPLQPDFHPKTTVQQASEMILDAFTVLGDEYREILRTALTQRWVDYADNIGKSTGAFCSSPYGAHPYILITWTDTVRGAFVLAHELGHAGHFALAQRHQRLINARPSTYFVEAPSTLNELLLFQYVYRQANDVKMRQWAIQQVLGTYYHNFVTHLLEGELRHHDPTGIDESRGGRHDEAGRHPPGGGARWQIGGRVGDQFRLRLTSAGRRDLYAAQIPQPKISRD